MLGGTGEKGLGRGNNDSPPGYARAEVFGDREKLKDFKMLQEARSRIKPLEDPEAQKAILRKQAARRKLRGRLGTILSDNTETLG